MNSETVSLFEVDREAPSLTRTSRETVFTRSVRTLLSLYPPKAQVLLAYATESSFYSLLLRYGSAQILSEKFSLLLNTIPNMTALAISHDFAHVLLASRNSLILLSGGKIPSFYRPSNSPPAHILIKN